MESLNNSMMAVNSTVSVGSTWSNNSNTYLSAFAPILLGHVIVPTIGYLSGRKNPILDCFYSLFPVFTKSNVYNMMLCPRKHKFPNDFQFLTYIFVHGSYPHMICNLLAAYADGEIVYHEFGALAFYVLYLTGVLFQVFPPF